MAAQEFRHKLEQLPGQDKRLLGALFAIAFTALAVGGIAGLVVVMDAAGFIKLTYQKLFQFLTLHASYLFYYWIYSAEAALVLTFILVYTKGARLTSTTRGVAWMGVLLIAAGFALNLIAVAQGAVPTYKAEYPLIKQYGTAGAMFLLGFIMLSLGLFLVALTGIATAIKPKLDGVVKEWSSITFASLVWMGLVIVTTVVAALLAYVPALQDLLGMTPVIKNFNYSMSWGVMFHNLHYLPIMGAVLVWYVLAEVTTGVKSIFGERFSKGIFSLYLLVVPPTSVYHMFLEPSVPAHIKVVGSILSLGVSIPTIAVGMLILASLHACASSREKGALAWLRHLPWRNPSFSALAMAMVSALGGGVIANVIIQEKFEALLGDTFAVPGYFHFFTLGAVTLAIFGILTQIIPALTGHRLYAPSLLNLMPYATVAGAYIFGIAGVLAGYTGVPRKTLDFSFQGIAPQSWDAYMVYVGIGGILMVAGSAVYALLLVLTALRDIPSGLRLEELPFSAFKVEDAAGNSPWFTLVVVSLLIAGVYIASIGAYEFIKSLPIAAAGGGH
jgi:cytochrome c oxidase subunit 1